LKEATFIIIAFALVNIQLKAQAWSSDNQAVKEIVVFLDNEVPFIEMTDTLLVTIHGDEQNISKYIVRTEDYTTLDQSGDFDSFSHDFELEIWQNHQLFDSTSNFKISLELFGRASAYLQGQVVDGRLSLEKLLSDGPRDCGLDE
jgi:hypothetical protein